MAIETPRRKGMGFALSMGRRSLTIKHPKGGCEMIFRKRENEDTLLFLVRWTARILALLIVGTLAMFIFGNEGVTTSITPTELVGLLFFPLGVAVGSLIGWRNELIGGLVSVGSLAAFYLVFGLGLTGRFPGGFYFLIFSIPGFLFLIYGVLRSPWLITHRRDGHV
jgi:hypothetical protein